MRQVPRSQRGQPGQLSVIPMLLQWPNGDRMRLGDRTTTRPTAIPQGKTHARNWDPTHLKYGLSAPKEIFQSYLYWQGAGQMPLVAPNSSSIAEKVMLWRDCGTPRRGFPQAKCVTRDAIRENTGIRPRCWWAGRSSTWALEIICMGGMCSIHWAVMLIHKDVNTGMCFLRLGLYESVCINITI